MFQFINGLFQHLPLTEHAPEHVGEVEERHAGKAHEGTTSLLHRNGKAEGEAVGVDRFGDYLRMNLDVRSEMERK